MLTSTTPDFAARVEQAKELMLLRDLADLNDDRLTYRRAFAALYKLGGKAIYEAEAQLKAEAQARRANPASAA